MTDRQLHTPITVRLAAPSHASAIAYLSRRMIENDLPWRWRPERVKRAIRHPETNVIVANGQTAVIGGLTTEDEVESEVGVPILKDIPVLGRLFKFTNKRSEVRDLVIFVTPSIVDDDLAMKN